METIFELARKVRTKEKAVKYLQERGILHKERFCKNGHSMRLCLSSYPPYWRCNKEGDRLKKGLRSCTWLENSNLALETIVYFVYCWCHNLTTTVFCREQLQMQSEAITDWKNYLREVCASALLRSSTKIGGVGLTVEIDESLFSRRKYNVGRTLPTQWVFGGKCRETRDCFMYAVPDRSAETLLTTIQECILPGTTIISDKWRAYSGIESLSQNYKHLQVNHSENFKDPETGAHTNTILWGKAKMRNKRECGTARSLIDSYMCEFLWRQRNKNKDLVMQLYKDIVDFYPLNN